MINLNDLMNNFGGETNETGEKENVRMSTARQAQFYIDLCRQKGQKVDETHKSWTYDEMSSKISELLSMKKIITATEKQINKIKELSERLGMPQPKDEVLRKMPIDQASALISKLIKKDKEENSTPSEAQLKMLVDMFICPDVNPLDIIPVHPTLIKEKKTLQLLNKRMLENKVDKVKDNNGNIYTLKEIQDELVKKNKEIKNKINTFDLTTLDKTKVGNFIQDNRKRFYEWKNERCTKEQRDFIRTLQERLATIYKWSTNLDEISSNIDGTPTNEVHSTVTDEVILTGQHILTDLELIQFSKDQASELIDMLQKEINNKELTKFQEEAYQVDDRKITDLAQLGEEEQEKIMDMFHKLYALIGQEAEDSILQSNIDETLKELIELCSIYAEKGQIYAICENVLDKSKIDAILA